jgi:putative ABC transport system permease protein
VKFLPLLLANLSRKKIRTALTVGSFAVAMFLFGLLVAVRAGFRQGIDIAGADRLVVAGRTGLIQPLPLPYQQRIRRLPGIADVTHATWFGGIYQDPKNFFAQFVIAPEEWLRLYPEFKVEKAQWRDYLADRQGVVVGAKLAKRFGWKVGDRIPLKAPGYLGGDAWEFNVRGIYRGTRPQDDEGQMWIRHEYFRERAPRYWQAIVGWYVVRVSDPVQAVAAIRTIDGEFANSASETRTQTEQQFAASFMKQMGNIEFLIMAVGTIVFFTLLLVTGNTMAIAVRERTNELAVLKAIGFSDRFALALVLAESLFIAALGGALGLALASAVAQRDITGGIIPTYLTGGAVAIGAAVALATGAIAGLLPALGAMRLQVAAALRRV